MSRRKSIKKRKVLREESEQLYQVFCPKNWKYKATELGSKQFYEWESVGLHPCEPDPYFLCLKYGKMNFNITQESIFSTWLTFEWWGLYSYWLDWKGQRWMLRHLFSWYPDKLPEWFLDENCCDPTSVID